MRDNKNEILSHIFLILIIVLSPWTRRLFTQVSFMIFVLITILTIFLFFLSVKKKHVLFLVIFINSVLIFLTLSKNIDLDIFKTSRVEQDTIIRRFDYYAKNFGKLYTNRYGIFYHYKIEPTLRKYEANLFENVDINGYFFASHPRETGSDREYVKFSVFLLPLFIVGFFTVLISEKKILILFVVNVLLSGLYCPDYSASQLLLYVYLVVFITYGFKICLKKIYLLSESQ